MVCGIASDGHKRCEHARHITMLALSPTAASSMCSLWAPDLVPMETCGIPHYAASVYAPGDENALNMWHHDVPHIGGPKEVCE